MTTAGLAAIDEHAPQAARAIGLPMLHVRRPDHGSQAHVGPRARARNASLPSMEAAARDIQGAAHGAQRVGFLLPLDPGVPRAGALAKYAFAFFRISSSSSALANARRNRISSACSGDR